MKKPTVIVIAGPTASGKTAFSIELAKQINGEIISCDSMQIYQEMNIRNSQTNRKRKTRHTTLYAGFCITRATL